MSQDVPKALTTQPAGPLRGALAAPASKSVTNRLALLASLADGTSVLRHPLDSDDTAAMRAGVQALGARLEVGDDRWRIEGTTGALSEPADPVDCRLSGTTMRFLTAAATLAAGPVTLTGADPLLHRPLEPLVRALSDLGAAVAAGPEGRPPVTVGGGGLDGGAVTVDARESSQFVSAVLLVAPYARGDVEVRAEGLAADAYVRLTVEAMRDWGAEVEELGDDPPGWGIRGGRTYGAREVTVEYDASAAAHLLALAAATGGEVTVTNAVATVQPDARFPDVLEQMGAEVVRGDGAVTVTGPERLSAVEADLTATPDQVTTLAALCALADGTSRITGVEVARGHETDRLAALARELGRLHVEVEESAGGLTIHGGRPRGPARLRTHDDHRLAMAFAAVGAAVEDVTIEDPGCVSKTYPRFWDDAASLGLRWASAAAER